MQVHSDHRSKIDPNLGLYKGGYKVMQVDPDDF